MHEAMTLKQIALAKNIQHHVATLEITA